MKEGNKGKKTRNRRKEGKEGIEGRKEGRKENHHSRCSLTHQGPIAGKGRKEGRVKKMKEGRKEG
jgi:hypothetical protein